MDNPLTLLSKGVNQLRYNIQCPICLDILCQPVTTKCNHHFCSNCVKKLFETKGKSSCPVCQKTITRRSYSKNNSGLEDIIFAVKRLLNDVEKDTGIDFAKEPELPTSTREASSGDFKKPGRAEVVKSSTSTLNKREPQDKKPSIAVVKNAEQWKNRYNKQYQGKQQTVNDSFVFPADIIHPGPKIEQRRAEMSGKVSSWLTENEGELNNYEDMSIIDGNLPKKAVFSPGNDSSSEEDLVSVSQVAPNESVFVSEILEVSGEDLPAVLQDDGKISPAAKDPYEFIPSQKSSQELKIKVPQKTFSKKSAGIKKPQPLWKDMSFFLKDRFQKQKNEKRQVTDVSFQVPLTLNDTFDKLVTETKKQPCSSRTNKVKKLEKIDEIDKEDEIFIFQSQNSQEKSSPSGDFSSGSDEEWGETRRKTLKSKRKSGKNLFIEPAVKKKPVRRSNRQKITKESEEEYVKLINKSFEDISNHKLMTASQLDRELETIDKEISADCATKEVNPEEPGCSKAVRDNSLQKGETDTEANIEDVSSAEENGVSKLGQSGTSHPQSQGWSRVNQLKREFSGSKKIPIKALNVSTESLKKSKVVSFSDQQCGEDTSTRPSALETKKKISNAADLNFKNCRRGEKEVKEKCEPLCDKKGNGDSNETASSEKQHLKKSSNISTETKKKTPDNSLDYNDCRMLQKQTVEFLRTGSCSESKSSSICVGPQKKPVSMESNKRTTEERHSGFKARVSSPSSPQLLRRAASDVSSPGEPLKGFCLSQRTQEHCAIMPRVVLSEELSLNDESKFVSAAESVISIEQQSPLDVEGIIAEVAEARKRIDMSFLDTPLENSDPSIVMASGDSTKKETSEEKRASQNTSKESKVDCLTASESNQIMSSVAKINQVDSNLRNGSQNSNFLSQSSKKQLCANGRFTQEKDIPCSFDPFRSSEKSSEEFPAGQVSRPEVLVRFLKVSTLVSSSRKHIDFFYLATCMLKSERQQFTDLWLIRKDTIPSSCCTCKRNQSGVKTSPEHLKGFDEENCITHSQSNEKENQDSDSVKLPDKEENGFGNVEVTESERCESQDDAKIIGSIITSEIQPKETNALTLNSEQNSDFLTASICPGQISTVQNNIVKPEEIVSCNSSQQNTDSRTGSICPGQLSAVQNNVNPEDIASPMPSSNASSKDIASSTRKRARPILSDDSDGEKKVKKSCNLSRIEKIDDLFNDDDSFINLVSLDNENFKAQPEEKKQSAPLDDIDDDQLNSEELLQKVMDNINKDIGIVAPKKLKGSRKRMLSDSEDEDGQDRIVKSPCSSYDTKEECQTISSESDMEIIVRIPDRKAECPPGSIKLQTVSQISKEMSEHLDMDEDLFKDFDNETEMDVIEGTPVSKRSSFRDAIDAVKSAPKEDKAQTSQNQSFEFILPHSSRSGKRPQEVSAEEETSETKPTAFLQIDRPNDLAVKQLSAGRKIIQPSVAETRKVAENEGQRSGSKLARNLFGTPKNPKHFSEAPESKLSPANKIPKREQSPQKAKPTIAKENEESRTITRKFQSPSEMLFVCSGLQPNMVAKVKAFAKILGARFSDNFNLSMTHLIVNVDENRKTSKTLKYLQAVASGKWVVSYNWILSSSAARSLLPEEEFEAYDMSGMDGPRRSRLSSGCLFKNVQLCFIEPFDIITVDKLEDIVMMCGGVVVNEPETFSSTLKEVFRLVVTGGELDPEDPIIQNWLVKHKALAVSSDWVLDSVSSYCLQPLPSFWFGSYTTEQALSCNVPEDLLIDDLETSGGVSEASSFSFLRV